MASDAQEVRADTETHLRELAYQQGRRDADVDARLLSHDRAIMRINGSIEKHAVNAGQLSEEIKKLGRKIDELAADRAADEAVAADREEQSRRVANRQVSVRTFAVGVVTIVVMLMGVIATLLAAVH